MPPDTTTTAAIIPADDFERLAFEASLPDIVDRARSGAFGPVVLVWREATDGHPTHLRFSGEVALVSLWDAYRSKRIR